MDTPPKSAIVSRTINMIPAIIDVLMDGIITFITASEFLRPMDFAALKIYIPDDLI